MTADDAPAEEGSAAGSARVLELARALHTAQPYKYSARENGPEREYRMPEVTRFIRNLEPAALEAIWRDYASGNERVRSYAIRLTAQYRDSAQGQPLPYVSLNIIRCLRLVPDRTKEALESVADLNSHLSVIKGLSAQGVLDGADYSEAQWAALSAAFDLTHRLTALARAPYRTPGVSRMLRENRIERSVCLRNRELLDFIVLHPGRVDEVVSMIADRRTDDADLLRAGLESVSALRSGTL